MQVAPERDAELSLKYVDMREFGEAEDGQLNSILSGLQFQHKLFLHEMGGLLVPQRISLENIKTVLDLVCGPGAWSIDFSKKYPGKHIYAVDSNYQMLQIARENAQRARAESLFFQGMHRALPLLFDDNTFDLIHIQNGTSFFMVEEWPKLMDEMFRLLKPGGWLHLVDFEMGPTSQPALDRVLTLLGQILKKLNRSISPNGSLPLNGCTKGPQRMAQHHFVNIGYQFYPVDLGGWNNVIGRAYLGAIVVKPEMILQLAVESCISTREQLLPLLREMCRELQQISFCGAGMLLSTCGQKPVEVVKN